MTRLSQLIFSLPAWAVETMLRVALTGGIGSGKTTVTDHLKSLNVPVLDADEISRALTKPGGPAVAPIIKLFGTSITTDRGELDRATLQIGRASCRERV